MRMNIIFSCLMFFFLLCNGCRGWDWTNFEYYNRSHLRLYVDVVGVTPDPSPGALVPNVEGDNTPVKSSHFGDPVLFDDKIKIVWTIDGEMEKREIVLKRDDFDIPSKIRGGKIKITYTAKGQWEVHYSH